MKLCKNFTRNSAVMFAVMAGLTCGCGGSDELEVHYGVSRGRLGRDSISGTGVLVKLFRDSGHQVVSTSRLSSRLEGQDTIIWFPQRGAPTDEAIEFFDAWLSSQPHRTLIFANRGFDAQHLYWRRAARMADSKELEASLRRRGAEALVEEIAKRRDMDKVESCAWFTMRHDRYFPSVCTDLRGPMLTGADPTLADLHWAEKFEFSPSHYERATLLANGNIPIVTRLSRPDWYDSKIILVTQSSFLLNLGLTNRQNRLLAKNLIENCESPTGIGRVAFLETDSAAVRESTDAPQHSPLSLFFHWPLSLPFWHALVAGFIACSAYFPGLGRPRPAPRAPLADFGRHVDALGQLLAETRDEDYARARLDEYLNYSQNESKSHKGITRLRKGSPQ